MVVYELGLDSPLSSPPTTRMRFFEAAKEAINFAAKLECWWAIYAFQHAVDAYVY